MEIEKKLVYFLRIKMYEISNLSSNIQSTTNVYELSILPNIEITDYYYY